MQSTWSGGNRSVNPLSETRRKIRAMLETKGYPIAIRNSRFHRLLGFRGKSIGLKQKLTFVFRTEIVA